MLSAARFFSLGVLGGILSLQACTPASNKANAPTQVHFNLRTAHSKSSSRALSSSADSTTSFELSADYCYALHLTGDHPQLRRVAPPTTACPNGPAGLGIALGLYEKGDTIESDIPAGPARRFDLLGIPKSKVPGASCANVLKVEPGVDAQHPNIQIGELTLTNFDQIRLIARGTADIKSGTTNEVDLVAVNDATSGVTYSCAGEANHVPVATDQSISTSEDTPKIVTFSGTDADSGDTLTYSIASQPLHGTLTLVGSDWIYKPTADYNGSDLFTFVASDGKDSSLPATVSVSVAAVDDAPTVANIIPPAFNQDTNSTITLPYFDADGDLATSCSVTNLQHLNIMTACACDGAGVCTVTVRGTTAYSGPASFDYGVTANSAASATGSAAITVINTTVPSITIGTASSSLINSASTLTFPLTFTSATSISLNPSDVVVDSTGSVACASPTVSGTGLSARTVTLTGCAGDGTVAIEISANAAQNGSNPSAAVSPSATVTVDNTPPSISVGTPSLSLANNSASITINVTVSGASSVNVIPASVGFSGGPTCTASVASGTTNNPVVTLSACTGDGSMQVHINAGSAQDSVGNSNIQSSNSSAIVIDNTSPTVTLGTYPNPIDEISVDYATTLAGTCTENGAAVNVSVSSSGGGSPIVFTPTCSAGSFAVNNGDLSPLPNGTLTINLSQTDAAGNTGSAAPTTTKSTHLVVQPVYPGFAHWGQYVQNNGTKPWNASGATCTSTTGGYKTCVHSGELMKVEVRSQTSCSNVVLTDSLSAFRWICDTTSGFVTFYSTGLKPGMHLSNLINFAGPSWNNNSVTAVITSPSWSLSSNMLPWWSTPVTSSPALSAGASTNLSSGPAVYAVTSSQTTGGIVLNADSISVVVAPNATLTQGMSFGTLVNPGANYKYHWVEGRLNCNNMSSSYGVNLGSATYFQVLDGLKITNCASSGIVMNGGINSLTRDVTVANSAKGIHLNYTSYATLDNVRVFNTTAANPGILLTDASNNVLSRIAVSGNAGDGIEVSSSGASYGSNNKIVALTTAQNSGDGLWIHGAAGTAAGNIVHSFVTLNNFYRGMHLQQASQSTASQIVATNGGTEGVRLDGASNNKFTGTLMVGNNTSDCFVTNVTGTDGLINTSCTNTGADGSSAYTGSTSNAVLRTTRSLASSIVGKVTSEGTNVSGASGSSGLTAINSSVLDWTRFDNALRAWGKYGAAALFSSTHQGYCSTGTCQIWDWSLKNTDTVVLNRSGNGSTPNSTFTPGSACPSEVNGTITLSSQTGGYTYLANAIEMLGEEGNGNGLCESNETCIYTPNYGAYQGHGTLNSCTFSNGIVTNVKMYGYSINGY
ncbi:MAG: cadherin-like domain-containing protein [Bdellovibrionales bacterium]|nr:cadherin-like domain-containing protein [Bdellovibrionales bacterium]